MLGFAKIIKNKIAIQRMSSRKSKNALEDWCMQNRDYKKSEMAKLEENIAKNTEHEQIHCHMLS